MNSWQKAVLYKLLSRRFTIFKWLITFVLVLSLTSCVEKAGSQEASVSYGEKPPQTSQISQQFSEVSPPAVIQDLRQTLEVYRPQVTIVTPQPDEVLPENTVSVKFQVKDLPIFKNAQWDLGPHLHVILDNQPYIAVYDLNQPLVLPDLSPGTHTLRVFASRPWHESFKNEGAYAQTTFHVFTKTDDNNPDAALPVLTYSRPKGDYGAEPILLDFYLTNAPLHLASESDPNNPINDWRIRCTINGESFILDRWQAVYLKGFQPGQNWVKLEFLDNQGNPVKNAFNTTARLINYQPKGKDTLSRIVRGDVKADEVRSIVDPNYTAKKSITEPTPTPTKIPTVETIPKPIPLPLPETTEIPEIPPTELKQPEVKPTPSVSPTLPEIIESPTPEPQPETTPQATEEPETVVPEIKKTRFGKFFQRRSRPTVEPTPSVSPTVPEIIESPTPEPQPEITPAPQVEISPEPQPEIPEKEVTESPTSRFSKYFQRRPSPTSTPAPNVSPTPEIPENPIVEPQEE
ncbi:MULTISPECIES: hypothetical protein [unclassified Anabaena]|uniref:hypothetical protein n=1 Tax=unclassified Anabaena TaxID=2619674 RepID=UPI0039C6ACF6